MKIKKLTWRQLGVVVFLALAVSYMGACNAAKTAVDPTGIWRGTVKNPSGELVAITYEIKREGEKLSAELINDTERLAASNVSLTGDVLKVRYDFYDGTLEARIAGDEMTGAFVRQWAKKTLSRELKARRNAPAPAESTNKSDLTGDWLLKVGTGDAQKLWRAAFQTKANQATGTIIPVSGDWGQMSGVWAGDELTLNRFDGINSRVIRLKAQPDGTLSGELDLGLFDPKRPVIAERISEQNKALVATLPDPKNYTRMKNPNEPFRFSFADLEGKTVAWDDPRFKNKVVVISITGSWCPNCHEETPYLQTLYQKYKDQGLEVLALAFEYTGEAARDTELVKIFAKRHSVTYPMLWAGATDEANQKLAQLENFGAYPTTLYIGRDGLVKHVHAGFEGRATGERFTRLKAEIESYIQELLAEK
jgi:thiol-disulfide isomerase/thioredoxin